MKPPAQLRIDIVSDVVCPWCAVGYKQLEQAIGLMADKAEFGIRWRLWTGKIWRDSGTEHCQ
jgi:predicted DsbA family dithiol-disulfide isomerase